MQFTDQAKVLYWLWQTKGNTVTTGHVKEKEWRQAAEKNLQRCYGLEFPP